MNHYQIEQINILDIKNTIETKNTLAVNKIGKYCFNCKRILDKSKFSIDNREKDRLSSKCKECHSFYYTSTVWGKCISISRKAGYRVGDRLLAKDLFLLWIAQDGKCVYKNEILNPIDMSLEHLKQVCTGGKNNIDNLVWTHEMCNLARNHKYTHEDLCWLIREDPIKVKNRINSVHELYFSLKESVELMRDFFSIRKFALTFDN